MRTFAKLLALLLLAGAAGCAGLPEAGSVRTEPANELVEEEALVDFTPSGPRTGADPVEIVRGFLVAMQATPLNTSVAREYLTAEASGGWVPEAGTVIYGDETRTQLTGGDVRLALQDTVGLDQRGSWLGARGDQSIVLDLVRDDGEWRIGNPPDRLIVPLTHFESRYHQYQLYFFDKVGEVLVPEPVHVPGGAQAPTMLVAGLLRGPARELLGVERTYLPARTVLDDISVPVTTDGTAEVPLSDDVLDLQGDRLTRAFAQLAWTLGQVPGVERFRVTVDGSPLDVPGVGVDVPVTAWSELGPAVAWASETMFGLREGRVVSIVGGEETPVSGPFGTLDLGVRSIGVDLLGERVAAATRDGEVLVAPRAGVGRTPSLSDVRTVVSGGTDLLPPVWDLHGQLWFVDRTDAGAAVGVVRRGELLPVQVDGVTGRDVRSFAVSRDGTRLAFEIAGRSVDRLLVARVLRDDRGRVRGALPAEPVPLREQRVDRVRDLEFRTPVTVALLTAPAADSSQVVLVKVDGSTTAADASSEAGVFRGRAARLVTSPAPGAALYVHTADRRMFVLAPSGRWTSAGIEPGLRSPTFVG